MKPPSTAALRSIASRRGSCAIASVGCASINAGVSTLRTLMNGSTATESRSPRRRRHEPEACDQANQGTVWPFSWEASLLLADELLERMASDAGNDLAKNLAEPILNDCSPNGNGSMSERNYRPTGHQAPAALLHISRLDASQIRVRCATRPALIALRHLQYMGNRQWQDQQQIHQTTTAWCS